ncbi:MAG: heavy metal translocating P-type ATPase, partial [Spirochaetaceae bacterium]|nr:heavy metal translocating P-type ATPase [Spirochaetaceae bacterium]
MKEKFAVTGMTCSSCSGHVEKAVRKVTGVRNVSVNLLQNSMTVEYDETVTGTSQITGAVKGAGYGAALAGKTRTGGQSSKGGGRAETAEPLSASGMRGRLIWSVVFLVPLLYIAMGPMAGLPLPPFLAGTENSIAFGMTQLLLTLAIVYFNRSYFINGFRSLFKGAPTMDALIAIGSGAAIVYGIFAIIRIGYGLALGDAELVQRYHMDMYFESAGTILTLITVGKYLEHRSKGRTSDAITRLLDLTPKTALAERGGTEVEIPVTEVVAGDILIVKAGSSVPVDGIVIEGSAAVDESAITGESIPAEKVPGATVTGATINTSGYIRMKATRVGEDTTLAQIIRLIEEAGASKAPIAKLADKVSAVFVPVVIAIAIAASIVWLIAGQPPEFALSIGIAVLVISCPCALGLATPTAIMVGTGKGAEQGILFRNAESIEAAHTVDTVILDKTGTATEGRPSVTGIYPAAGISETELLSFAAGIEKKSEHPLGSAIMEKYNALTGTGVLPKGSKFSEVSTLPEVTEITQIPGQGI